MVVEMLAIKHESASWIMNAVRTVFWTLAKGVLYLLDGMFEVINDVWKFKFFENSYVNTVYKSAIIVACTWLILKVVIEYIRHYILEQDDNSSPTRVIKWIVISITLMFLIPPVFSWGYNLSAKMTNYVVGVSSNGSTSSTTMESTMSTMILSAFSNDDKMEQKDKKYFIEHWKSADYNKTVDGFLLDKGDYSYSFNTFPIFLTGLIVVIMLFFIGIQVAKRVIELALYKVIGPFVCTSLVSQRSRTFEVWVKGVMGAFIVTTVQYLCIGILFNVFGSVVKGTNHVLSVVLIIIGGLLFIISSPQLISSLLNVNTGALSNLNGLQTLTSVATSMMAMSKMSKVSESSNSSNSSSSDTNNNSENSNSSDSSGQDINSPMNNSNYQNNTETSQQNSYSSNDSSGNVDPSNDSAYYNSSYDYTDLSMASDVSLEDRIEVFKGMDNSSVCMEEELSSVSEIGVVA